MSKPIRKKPPPKTASVSNHHRKIDWYSQEVGAENFAILDKAGRIKAQVKIYDAPGLAAEIIAALNVS